MVLFQMLLTMEMTFAVAFCLLFSDVGPNAVVIERKIIVRQNPMRTLTHPQFKKEFHFSKGDMPRLFGFLSWPSVVRISGGIVFTAEIFLLVVLYKFV